jgi:hypothetical protein
MFCAEHHQDGQHNSPSSRGITFPHGFLDTERMPIDPRRSGSKRIFPSEVGTTFPGGCSGRFPNGQAEGQPCSPAPGVSVWLIMGFSDPSMAENLFRGSRCEKGTNYEILRLHDSFFLIVDGSSRQTSLNVLF